MDPGRSWWLNQNSLLCQRLKINGAKSVLDGSLYWFSFTSSSKSFNSLHFSLKDFLTGFHFIKFEKNFSFKIFSRERKVFNFCQWSSISLLCAKTRKLNEISFLVLAIKSSKLKRREAGMIPADESLRILSSFCPHHLFVHPLKKDAASIYLLFRSFSRMAALTKPSVLVP